MPCDIGNRLVRQYNVVLCLGYGASEIAGVMSSARDYANDKDWEYLRPYKSFRPFMKFENRGDDLTGPFELIVRAGWPCITVPNREDGSYATKDLFVPHPSIPEAYKCVGRADDTLVHINGEKTNPVPVELEMRASPYVAECLVFGAIRSQAGVLIVPSDLAVRTVEAQATSLEAVEQKLSKLLWAAVESANKEAPSHSQIIPELVKVLPAGTSFPSADKGSLIRPKVVQAFQREIDQVYEAYEAGSNSMDDVVKIKLLDMATSIEVTAQVISEVSQRSVSALTSNLKDTDFVDLGIDSLKSTRVRNMLQKRLELPSDLPSNLVFEHPSVVQLAGFLFKHSSGTANGRSNGDSQRSENRKAVELLEEFKGQILKRDRPTLAAAARDDAVKHTVVLTGSTGSLGAHLVDQLARINQVETVICLDRAKNDEDARKRTEDSLLTRGLGKLDRLASSTSTTIMCLAAELAEPQLGLQDSSWKLLSSKTTCVIHNGWPVNFNMAVQSFRSPILGSVNLINLVAQSPATARPRFIFSSSISTIAGKICSQVDEEYPVDIGDAANMGYGRSKWVVEKLCEYAQQHIGDGFDAVIARIGQMVGDRRSGIWNETEAWPLMLKSAQTIGCLPELDERISWQPVDDSAFFVAGMVMPPRLEGVFHVFNSAASSHSELIDLLKKPENLGDSFEVVARNEWLRRLSESDPDPRRNPTIKLLEHYRAQYGQAQTNGNGASDRPIDKEKIITNDRLLGAFGQLGLQREAELKLVPIDASLIHNMISAWRRSGFLS
ncbi:NRPS-like enzyme [Pseudozyma hubeiensis SY62]|uniref:NRPS-like enzyme n=1 Tax=Pseudozyma hubeiensis (strain SY62) TaxID=1305764 RepID=R9PA89_PSEHS|nr:NRPS-like enzyme [Pseudozyma hubeiensis SY62]GAC98281.1 NRPS-like enzyme [Pseudozyma hubeiensis SY62]